MGLANLPEHFFGMIFTFKEDVIIPRFLLYLCGYFDTSSKLNTFFPVILSRQLDHHLLYLAFNSEPKNLELILEGWLSRAESSEIELDFQISRAKLILSLIADFFGDKKYKIFDEINLKTRAISSSESNKKRDQNDQEIEYFLLQWVFSAENFKRLAKVLPAETCTLYFKILSIFQKMDRKLNFSNPKLFEYLGQKLSLKKKKNFCK